MKKIFRPESLKLLLFLLGILSIFTILNKPIQAQPLECPLSFTVSYAPVQQLSIADVDFEHFESRILLFTLRFQNASDSSIAAQLVIEMNVRLASGAVYNQALYFKSKQFDVPHGVMIVTNIDFGRTGRIQSEEFRLSDEAKTNIQDVALASGKFPAGIYSYRFSLITSGCEPVAADPPEIKLSLENPTRVELRSPRDGEFTIEFPLFEFFHEGNKAELLVTEKEADQTPEDAIANVPWMNKIEIAGQNSYLYSGGRPLEQGKTYVWQVVSKTTGLGGIENQVASPIWSFTIQTTQQGAGSVENTILKILEEMFHDKYRGIFEQIRDGEFALSGQYIWNETPVAQGELLSLLNELRQYIDEVELTFE